MILSKDTNTVYFSQLLSSDKRFSATCNSLTSLLGKHEVKYKFLKGTKDIWCRDYMPIQKTQGDFVQFRYEPSYLKDHEELRSNPKEVCHANNLHPKFSRINLDGGNIVNWLDRAIITDRVFDENPEYDKIKLIAEIENLLEVQIIVIPQIKSDMTGHADGLVRFVDKNTLIGNNREKEFKYWTSGMNKVLKEHGINYIDIPFLDHKIKQNPEHAIGCYVNYLEVKDLIVLPIFETEGNQDQTVLELFKEIFKDRKIETINYNPIALFGGLLNCTTWTIKE